MANKATDDHTPISSQVGTQPTRPPDRHTLTPFTIQSLPLHRLARIITRLPLDKFIPLNDAFARAGDLLGSGDLAAHDLTQHARANARAERLIVAARWIMPNGTERVVIFRLLFWQYYAIERYDDTRPVVRGVTDPAGVRGGRLPGNWFFFVGCRRFERLYSIAAPTKTAAGKSPVEQRPSPPTNELPLPPPKSNTPDTVLIGHADESGKPKVKTAVRSRTRGIHTSWQQARARKVLEVLYPDGYPTSDEVPDPDLITAFDHKYAQMIKDGKLKASAHSKPSPSSVLREVGRKTS